jgi:hypothetical protein
MPSVGDGCWLREARLFEVAARQKNWRVVLSRRRMGAARRQVVLFKQRAKIAATAARGPGAASKRPWRLRIARSLLGWTPTTYYRKISFHDDDLQYDVRTSEGPCRGQPSERMSHALTNRKQSCGTREQAVAV